MSARDERQCERFRETVSLLLDGEDGALESAAHRAHAARCAACRAYAAQLRTVSAVLRETRLERPARRLVL